MSKKIIFFAILTLGLFFSCQKTNIQPQANASNTEVLPVWKNSVTSSNFEIADHTGINDRLVDVKKDIDCITDPNNDEDRNKKKKANN